MKLLIYNILFITSVLCTACLSENPTGNMDNKIETRKHTLIKPGPEKGKEAAINIYIPLENRTNNDYLPLSSWTVLGERITGRLILNFDLDFGERTILIDSVLLNLHLITHSDDSPTFEGNSGENAFYIRRVIEDWDTETVTWVNQPKYTNQYQVLVPAIKSKSTGVVKANVTDLFCANWDENLNRSNISFYLKLKKEKLYTQVYFASSHYPDSTKYPELEIFYREIE